MDAMGEQKQQPRSYAPDFVSVDTLAHRLDCPVETIEMLVRTGELPRPCKIGTLVRWDYERVVAFLRTLSSPKVKVGPNGLPGPEIDPFLAALETEREGAPK
jgi:excisionase family DNA binding protein